MSLRQPGECLPQNPDIHSKTGSLIFLPFRKSSCILLYHATRFADLPSSTACGLSQRQWGTITTIISPILLHSVATHTNHHSILTNLLTAANSIMSRRTSRHTTRLLSCSSQHRYYLRTLTGGEMLTTINSQLTTLTSLLANRSETSTALLSLQTPS